MVNTEKNHTSSQSITNRIILVGFVLGIIFILLSIYMANQYMKKIKEQRIANLNQMIQIARNAIEPTLIQYRAGELKKDETIENVRNLVRRMTYHDHVGSNYIFMSTYKGIMLVQPFEPLKEMTNQWNLKDDYGIYIMRGLVETARKNKEGGYFNYHYHSPSSPAPEEKISFVLGIPELNCYIGTGKYMGDIRKAQYLYLFKILILNAVLIGLLILLVKLSLREIQNRNKALLDEIRLHRLTENELIEHRNHLKKLVKERTAKLQQEITQRKQAEKNLTASERRLDAIIKTVPDIIYRLDADGIITFISDAIRQYGYRPGKLLGTSIMDLVYHEDKDKVISRMNERRTRDRSTSSFEVRLLTTEQKNILFEIFSVSAEGLYSSKSPSQNTFLGTQGIARDITERKQAEEEREELIIELKDAIENVKTLSGLVPICAHCKKIRDDKGYWNQIEGYIQKYSEIKFSHGICPECSDELYGEQEWYIKAKKKRLENES